MAVAAGALLLLAEVGDLAQAQSDWDKVKLTHSKLSEQGSFNNLLLPDSYAPGGPKNPNNATWSSQVHVLWPTHVEVIPLTEDIGGKEPVSFHEDLAHEAISGWQRFRDNIAPSLPQNHPLKNFLNQEHAGALNDGFFHFQKRVFESEGDVRKALGGGGPSAPTPPPDANSSWPEMQALTAYRKLRLLVERLSRRYLIRSGLDPEKVMALNYSIFNWAAVHGAGEFHGPHTHVGEYHVGVFYAQAGGRAGKLRFGDPRGHSPPFGQSHFHTPRSGDLVFFPSWLSHMATVTAPTSDLPEMYNTQHQDEPYRVVFSFNIGPVLGSLPCHYWFSDSTGKMKFTRHDPINERMFGPNPTLDDYQRPPH